MTYSQAYREGVAEEMAADERIFVMGTDILLRGGHFAQVAGLGERFGRGASARCADLRGRDGRGRCRRRRFAVCARLST